MELKNKKNSVIEQEQLKVKYWMRQAYILKSKLGKCRDCSNNTQKKELDRWFFGAGGTDCAECDGTENKEYTNFIKQYGNKEEF